MKISIRRALPADAKIIAGFNRAIASETEGVKLDSKRVLKGVRALLRDESKGFYLVAEIEGKIAGQLMITYEWSDWRNSTFWWIQSVYVAPGFRGAGVFTQLFRHIEKEAMRRKSVCGLRLYVEGENSRARKIYERLGMSKAAYEMYETDFVLKRPAKHR